jgi:hypothetical protein
MVSNLIPADRASSSSVQSNTELLDALSAGIRFETIIIEFLIWDVHDDTDKYPSPVDSLARRLSLEGSNHGVKHVDEETFVGVVMDQPHL